LVAEKYASMHYITAKLLPTAFSDLCTIFSVRQHICYSALYAIARPSGRLSVCPPHGWISQGRFKIGSRNLHHSVAP